MLETAHSSLRIEDSNVPEVVLAFGTSYACAMSSILDVKVHRCSLHMHLAYEEIDSIAAA